MVVQDRKRTTFVIVLSAPAFIGGGSHLRFPALWEQCLPWIQATLRFHFEAIRSDWLISGAFSEIALHVRAATGSCGINQ